MVYFVEGNVAQGNCHLLDVVSVAWLVLGLVVDTDTAHQHGVEEVHILEDISLAGAIVADLILEVDTAAVEDIEIEEDNFGSLDSYVVDLVWLVPQERYHRYLIENNLD